MQTDWVDKIIQRIGEAAKIIVDAADGRTGRPIKTPPLTISDDPAASVYATPAPRL